MFVPPSRRCVAKACRSEWNETFFVTEALPAASLKTFSAVDEPTDGSESLPVLAQRPEQDQGQHDVAVLAPFPLLDADHHPLAVDVAGEQPQRLAQPQAAAVGRHQEGLVLEVRAGIEDRRHLLGREDLGEDATLLLVRHALDRPVRLLQALTVEEAEGAGSLVESGEPRFALAHEVPLIRLDVLGDDGIEGLGHETGEAAQHPRVGLLRPQAATTGRQRLGEQRLESIGFHASSLSRDATWRKLRLEESRQKETMRRPRASAAKRLRFNNQMQLTAPAQAMKRRS
jgi:hypothetical protein